MPQSGAGNFTISREEDTLTVAFSGNWHLQSHSRLPQPDTNVFKNYPGCRSIRFEVAQVGEWDSRLLVHLLKWIELASERHWVVDQSSLPEGIQSLITMARTVPRRTEEQGGNTIQIFLKNVGSETFKAADYVREFVSFIGEVVQGMIRLSRGKAQFRWSDFGMFVEETGPNALPIITLISFLVGLILAFVGAVQLKYFGAQIYVANLVGLGMAREMGAMMAAIIMSGRTGAAFAAQLGTMRVNEEIDALETFSINPIDYLVLPRLLALTLMMPLLCIYADVIGIIGGATVCVGFLDLRLTEYYQQTIDGLTLNDFIAGLIKSSVFGVLIALAGCLRGMHSGRDAQAVGLATTSAVVTSIVLIVVFDAIITIIYTVFDF